MLKISVLSLNCELHTHILICYFMAKAYINLVKSTEISHCSQYIISISWFCMYNMIFMILCQTPFMVFLVMLIFFLQLVFSFSYKCGICFFPVEIQKTELDNVIKLSPSLPKKLFCTRIHNKELGNELQDTIIYV